MLSANGIRMSRLRSYVPSMIPDLPPALLERYSGLANIGAICVLFKLTRPLTPYFWVNTTDPEIAIPGVIEYSNLQPLPDHVVYVSTLSKGFAPGLRMGFCLAPEPVLRGPRRVVAWRP